MVKVPLGDFLQAAQIKGGEVVVFADEGWTSESKMYKNADGTPKQDFNMRIEFPDGEMKKVTLNLSSRRLLAARYGNDSKNWVTKKAEIIKTVTPQGKDMLIFKPVE